MRRMGRGSGTFSRMLAVCLLGSVGLLSARLWAQGPDDEDDDDSDVSYATLTLRYDARGTADVDFYANVDPQRWNSIAAALEQTLHCSRGDLAHPPPNPVIPKYLKTLSAKAQAQYLKSAEEMRERTVAGKCPGAMTRKGLLLSSDIPLATLAAQLKGAGVARISINVSYPKSKYSEQTPGTKVPWDTDSPYESRNPEREMVSRAYYLIDTGAASPPSIHLAFGLRARDAVRVATLPVIFLLSPVLICLWMGRAAIRDAKTDATAAWFSYFRVLTWCGNCLILIWMVGQTIRQGVEVLASYYTAAHSASAVALWVGILMAPPWLAYFVCVLLSYRVYVAVRGETWTRGEFIVNQTLTIASQFLPLACFLAGIGMISVNGQAAMALFAGVYVSFVGCRWLSTRYSGTHLEPLTRGGLRDHVFELAKKAAVEVRQVYVMPAGKSQMANAFASSKQHVFFTDYLLSRLNKREVSAIAAHEITHIQKKHTAWKMAAFIVLIFSSQILFGILTGIVGFLRHSLETRQAAEGASAAHGLAATVHVADQVLAFPELILILYSVGLFLYFLHSRYLEYVADAGAVQLTGDPEAVISSLLRLGRLNLTPVQWDRATGSLLTHPSMLKRVQRVATIGQVSQERFEQLLRDSANTGAQNSDELWTPAEQFDVAAPENPVVTLSSKRGELARKKLALRFADFVPAALVAWAVTHYRPEHRFAAYFAGALLCLGLFILMGEWVGVWFRASLRQKVRTRIEAEGIEFSDGSAELVCVSPHGTPRAYALGYEWDTGLLIPAKDRLCFVGDLVRFALRPEQIVSIRLGPGVPTWFAEPRIYIDWQRNSGDPVQTWNLLPKEPYAIFGSKRQSIEFLARLQRWKLQPSDYVSAPASLENLEAPSVGEVTSQRIKSVIGFGRFVRVLSFNQIFAVVACVIFSVPAIWFVCLVDLVAMVYSFMPFWFFRDPKDVTPAITLSLTGSTAQDNLQTGD